MAREILKVRKVGATLVVTLTQGILEQIPLEEGDRVFVEPIPPRKILITKEGATAPNSRRLELELESLKARKRAIESDIKYKVFQANSGMPTDEGMQDESTAKLILHSLEHERDKVGAEIAAKRLELFELAGDSNPNTLRFIKSDFSRQYDHQEYMLEGTIECTKNCGRGTYNCLIPRKLSLSQQELLKKNEYARILIAADCPFHEKHPEFEL